MPLSELQRDVLRLLAAHRDPESYAALAATRSPDGYRDAFFGATQRRVAEADVALLIENGFDVQWSPRLLDVAAVVQRGDQYTSLQWTRHGDLRFFRAVKDEHFGFRLHVFDVATNKALAAGVWRGPRDARDLRLDLLYVHERHIPLGAVIWAAVAKNRGNSAWSLISAIRFNAYYLQHAHAKFASGDPLNAADLAQRWSQALEKAEQFVTEMPFDKEGLAFLNDGKLVQPDPKNLGAYVEHGVTRRGVWPSSPEIETAMLHLD